MRFVKHTHCLGAASLGSEAPEPMCRPLDDKWRRLVGGDLVGFPSNPRTEHRSMHHHRILNCMSIHDASFSHTHVLTNSPRSISNSSTHNPQGGVKVRSCALSLSLSQFHLQLQICSTLLSSWEEDSIRWVFSEIV